MNSSALEAPAFVSLTFNVRHDLDITSPIISTATHFATVSTATASDDAIFESTREMFRLLKSRLPLDPEEISMLMTGVGNNEICVVCGTESRTMRFSMPHYALDAYGFRF
jgi:amidase